MQKSKQGIFTSLGEQYRPTTSRKRLNDTSLDQLSFRHQGIDSTRKDPNPNGSLNTSPLKIQHINSRSPLGHMQYSPVRFTYGYPLQLSGQPVTQIQTQNTFRQQAYPHPSAIKTIVQAPVPIINPVLIGSSGDNSAEIERLQTQVEMLMDQYKYVYGLYEELAKAPPPEGPKATPKYDNKDKENREIAQAAIAIRATQISSLIDDFGVSINHMIDKIVDERIRNGMAEVQRINSESISSIRIEYR